MTGESEADLTSAKPVAGPSGLLALMAVARRHGLHLTVPQLVRDNHLPAGDVTAAQIARCGRRAGLKCQRISLGWRDLASLGKALPAILILANGASMVLLRTETEAGAVRAVLQDPATDRELTLALDSRQFRSAWTGQVVLVRRNYDLSDEAQPFGFPLIAGQILRETRIVRDIAISALMLSLLALAPIMFWRLMSERVLQYQAVNTFVVLSATMAILIGFETAFAALRRHLLLAITTSIDLKLSVYLFDKLLNLPVSFFETTPAGLITYKMAQINRIREFMIGHLFGTILDSTVLLVFVPVMFFFSPMLTFVVLGFCAIIFVWIASVLPAYTRISGAVEQAESAKGAFLSECIYGIRTVKSLSLDSRQRHEWDALTARVARLRLKQGRLSNIMQSVVMPLDRTMVSGSFALAIYFAISSNNPVYVSSIFSFLLLSQRASAPLLQMSQLIQQYDEARLAVGIVGGLVNQPEEQGRSGHGVRSTIEGDIAFSDVHFAYEGSVQPALRSVSLHVPKGTTLGVMGRSGSGKTTITRLLQRLHSDFRGLIKIDGIDVREYDVDHLRASLGVVLQDNFLFAGTIRSNITAAKIDATYDEMVLAARLAGAEEFIEKLPRGYETHIYEGSPNLSGGQRQRLAIARALITSPRVLILDEATSALDAESEAIINANLERIAHGRTLIIISHRLSSLVRADAILVLERGEVNDIGRHEELLERNPIYRGLWHTQNQHVTAGTSRPRLVAGGSGDAA